MSASFDLSEPGRVTVGAVGPPGKRVFYLQARQGDELVSLKLEKEQVLFLAGGLTEVLADLAAPSATPGEDDLGLEEPVLPAWSIGSMQLAYDPTADRVVLVAREVAGSEASEDDALEPEDLERAPGDELDEPLSSEEAAERLLRSLADWAAPSGEDAEGAAGVARVRLTREQAAGVIEHGKRLLRAGRPPCPNCGYPLGEDHSCPKMNGHQAPSL